MSAEASDDHLVSRVEFTAGAFLIGTDSAAPWSVAWNSGLAPNGTYDFRATAYDGAGNVAVSEPVAVQVKDETPPTVAITSPANGAQVRSTPITVRATAGDNGLVRLVELWVTELDELGVPVAAAELYATQMAPPPADTTVAPPPQAYAFDWSAGPGTYALVAKAVDGAGLAKDSAPVTILVGDTVSPTCSVKLVEDPDPGVEPSHVVGAILVEAEAVDDTEVALVEIFQIGAPPGAPDQLRPLAGARPLVRERGESYSRVSIYFTVDVTERTRPDHLAVDTHSGSASLSAIELQALPPEAQLRYVAPFATTTAFRGAA